MHAQDPIETRLGTIDITNSVRRYALIWRCIRVATAYVSLLLFIYAELLVYKLSGMDFATDLMRAKGMIGTDNSVGWPHLFAYILALLIVYISQSAVGRYGGAHCTCALVIALATTGEPVTYLVNALAAVWRSGPAGIDTMERAANLVVGLAIVIFSWWAIVALLRQWNVKLGGSGTSAFAVTRAFARAVARRRQSYRSVNRFAGVAIPIAVLLFAAVATVVVIAPPYVFAELLDDSEFPASPPRGSDDAKALFRDFPGIMLMMLATVGLVMIAIPTVGVLIHRITRRLIQQQAEALIRSGDYAPIVYLRSFEDEDTRVTAIGYWRRLTRMHPRLEEVLVRSIARLGPPIAIGLPGEQLPRLGAMRAYYDDDTWQDAFKHWVQRARLIVVLAGTTRWSLWELNFILSNGLAPRLVLILPPSWAAGGTARHIERWNQLTAAAVGTPWERALAEVSPRDVLALTFLSDGRLTAVTSRARRQADYELASRVAVVAGSALA